MNATLVRSALVLVMACTAATTLAQPPAGDPGPGGPGQRRGFGPPGGGPGGPREDLELVEKFDKDGNGWLDRKERAKAREVAKEGAEQRRGGPPRGGPPGGGPRGGPGGGPRGGGPRGQVNREPAKPGRKVAPSDVEQFPDAELYDPTTLRTLFFEFENEDWEKELEDFHGTDVDVPAQLTVDGKKYSNVGMRFRGMSSYFRVPAGYKRSLNVSIDLADEDQRLYGYRTLNLLNSAGDPSLMSTVLYSHIASEYIPVPKANHVRVVINGESWGVYVNVQQYDKDFLAEHFESTKGTRWKVSGNPRADGGLRYLGEDLEQYKQRFDMKSSDGKKAWAALVLLCKTLNETPLDKLESELEPMLNIDGALRFLALDVALVNSDGYWTRASDYSIFLDKDKRFHLIPHDMNEALGLGHGGPGGPGGPGGRRGPGGGRPGFAPGDGPPREFAPGGDQRRREPRPDDRPLQGQNRERFSRGDDVPQDRNPEDRRRSRDGFGGPPRGPGGPGGPGGGPRHGGPDLDPLVSIDNPRMPLRSRLLAVPSLRSKYLNYVREIAKKSLAPENVEPVIARHAKLIEDEVAKDTRKLDTLEAFRQANSLSDAKESESGSSLRSFIAERRKFLLQYQEPVEGDSQEK